MTLSTAHTAAHAADAAKLLLLPGSLMFIFSNSNLCRIRQSAWYLGLVARYFLAYAGFQYSSELSTAVLVWKCLHDAAHRYLADLCVHGRQQQCVSQASGTLLVPRTRIDTSQRSFAVNGPRI